MASPPPDAKVQDFATSATPARARFADRNLHVDTQVRGRARSGTNASTTQIEGEQGTAFLEPHSAVSRFSVESPLRRRLTRTNTVRNYESPSRPKWEEPGAEPGVDTAKETEVHHALHQLCEITIVDYSDERVERYSLDNDNLQEFLDQPKEDWVACRWINVNGLSWDVIRTLGNHKGLHPLAIEDLMHTRSRTKADWYPDQAFCKYLRLRLTLRWATMFTKLPRLILLQCC